MADKNPIFASLERDRQWARAKVSGAHGLRRGAWYLVVNRSSKMVVLEVQKTNVPVPRELIELSHERPEAWSVVRWDRDQFGATRAGQSEFGLTYAVCWQCRHRQVIEPEDAARMTCASCEVDAPVDWVHPC